MCVVLTITLSYPYTFALVVPKKRGKTLHHWYLGAFFEILNIFGLRNLVPMEFALTVSRQVRKNVMGRLDKGLCGWDTSVVAKPTKPSPLTLCHRVSPITSVIKVGSSTENQLGSRCIG